MSELGGKVALITGASRGIGRAVAVRLASEGAAIYLAADGTEGELTEVAAACRKAGAPDAAWGVQDLARADAPEAMIAAAHRRMGRIDILVNNAGIQRRAPFHEFPQGDWDDIIATNLTAPFVVSQAVVPGMMERKHGKIIHIASLMSDLARPTVVPYTAAKGGVRQLTRGMAIELAPHNIQVNAIAPGYFATNNTAEVTEDVTLSDSGDVISDNDGFGVDSDPDGDAITVIAVAGQLGNVNASVAGVYGSVTIASTGSYTYTLDNASPLVQALAAGQTVTDTFTYTISDGNGGTATATLTVNIIGVDDLPLASNNLHPDPAERARITRDLLAVFRKHSIPAVGLVTWNNVDGPGGEKLLESARIDGTRRAETLSVAEFVALANVL